MAHLERSERAGRQGHWRRKQHRWNGADHFHNDNRAPVYQQYDGVGGPGSFQGPPRPLQTVGRQDDHSGLLDELTLKHMAQDCGSLKNQLLRLKNLLQLEDTGLPGDVAEESEDNTAALQLEELMTEVRVLRDELRSRDKTIAQLTLQCKQLQKQQQQQQQQREQDGRQGRCQCHHQRAPSALRSGERQMERRTHYDKATQTHWRGPGHTPQILQPSSSCLTEHLRQEKLVRTPPTGVHSDPTGVHSDPAGRSGGARAGEASVDFSQQTGGGTVTDSSGLAGPPPASPAPNPDEISLLGAGANRRIQDYWGDSAVAPRGARGARHHHRPTSAAQPGTQPGPPTGTTGPLSSAGEAAVASASCPRVLQAPRLHKRVSVPALPRGSGGVTVARKAGSCSPAASPLLPAHLRTTKQLPPPSRGLPCFGAGPLSCSPLRAASGLVWKDPVGINSTAAASELSLEEECDPSRAATRALSTLSLSRLPKPKII